MNVENFNKKANALRQAHENNFLVLPNVWNALGALMIEEAGFPVMATSSSAVAITHW